MLRVFPQPPRQQDVDVARNQRHFANNRLGIVVRPQRCQQQHVLQREAVLGIVEDMLQAGDRSSARLHDAQILPAVEVEVPIDKTV